MSVTVQKSGNVQGKTIKLEEQCTWTDYYTGEGMQGTGTRERNVQEQTISQGKEMFRDRQFHGGKECLGTDHYLEIHFKSVSRA